jgi:hypothetical protein
VSTFEYESKESCEKAVAEKNTKTTVKIDFIDFVLINQSE